MHNEADEDKTTIVTRAIQWVIPDDIQTVKTHLLLINNQLFLYLPLGCSFGLLHLFTEQKKYNVIFQD